MICHLSGIVKIIFCSYFDIYTCLHLLPLHNHPNNLIIHPLSVSCTGFAELFQSLSKNFLRHLLHGLSWSSFPQFAKSLPWARCPCYFMPQQLNGTRLMCCRLQKKLGKWLRFKCDLLYFSRGGRKSAESVWVLCWAPQPLHPAPLYVSSCAGGPAVMTSLCCAEHLQPGRGLRQSVACLCRWHLLPWGPGIIFLLFSRAPECEPVCLWIL